MIIPHPLVLTLLKIKKLENIPPFLDVIKIKLGREEMIKNIIQIDNYIYFLFNFFKVNIN